jgi:nicotinate-nucleotide adenylyltransferase
MNPRSKVGLYGGSFDPIHHGHLILARDVRERLGLERMIFIPAGVSPHKLDQPPAPPAVRLEMVRAAVAGEEGFECDDCEVTREGPSFAIDTVRLMMGRHPGAEIFYLIGGDNLQALDTWKEIDALRELVTFVVLARGGGGMTPEGFVAFDRRVDISSTDIRKRIATGRPVSYLLPEAVCTIVFRHRLYRND